MDLTIDDIQAMVGMRRDALIAAREIVTPIIEDFKPEAYRVTHTPSALFSQAPGTTITPAETVVNLYIQVADWLLMNDGDD